MARLQADLLGGTSHFSIVYDSLPEGRWFQRLDARLRGADLESMPASPDPKAPISRVLEYDRPDIVLAASGHPILVVERTEEVPSGHNVGQRYARLVAAARNRVPVVYMFPYAARKHGGETAGPRYANLRLFQALKRMAMIHDTTIITVNWPVDPDFELIRGPAKDRDIAQVVSLVLDAHEANPSRIHDVIRGSGSAARLAGEVESFAQQVARRAEYDGPPDSVVIGETAVLLRGLGVAPPDFPDLPQTVLYRVGMRYLRSDPYTGMAMLYDYLYARESPTTRSRALVLHFPFVGSTEWKAAVERNRGAKTVKLFADVADLVVFADGYLSQAHLLHE